VIFNNTSDEYPRVEGGNNMATSWFVFFVPDVHVKKGV
jgi:hypothetical protein